MIIVTKNNSINIIEESGQMHILAIPKISYRITNPDMVVLYKVDDPERIFIQEEISKTIVNEVQLTTDNALNILATLFPVTSGDSYSKEETNDLLALKVNKSGDTMTGGLILNGDPTIDLMAVPKQYLDKKISDLESNVLTFKGFVSTTEPIEDIRVGNYWYNGDALPTIFPITVSEYNGTDWTTQTQYTPSAFDTWHFENNAWYYFGDVWNQIDFSGSTFDSDKFEVVNGVVKLKAGGITTNEIAANAAIDLSKTTFPLNGISNSYLFWHNDLPTWGQPMTAADLEAGTNNNAQTISSVLLNTQLNKCVKLESDSTQIINSDLALTKTSKLLGTDANGTQHTIGEIATYNEGTAQELVQNELANSTNHTNINSLDRPTVEMSTSKEDIAFISDLPILISQTDFDNLTDDEKLNNNYDVYIP